MRGSSFEDEFLTAKEIAVLTKLSVSKVYELIGSGKLAAHRMDRSVRVSKIDFDTFLDKSRVDAPAAPPVRRQHAAPAATSEFRFIKINQAPRSQTSSRPR